MPIQPNQTGYARCRASWQGHDWDDAPAPEGLHAPRGWLRVGFRCSRCGTRKTYLFNPRSGETSRPRYSHRPRDYAAPGTTRADWKVLFVAQYVKEAAA